MIRDLNESEKIKYAQKCIDDPVSLFWFWCFDVENLFDDITFYMDTNPGEISRRAKITGILCSLVVIPTLLIAYGITQLIRGFGLVSVSARHWKSNRILQVIILIFFLIPSYIVHIPFSIYTFYILKKNALIYLIISD